MGKYPLRTQQEDALYTPAVRALYRGNPWIEALPDSLTDQELFWALQGKIPYDENERTLDHYQREACIQSISSRVSPLYRLRLSSVCVHSSGSPFFFSQ